MVRYHYRDGVTLDKKKHRWLIIFIGLIVIAAAVYITAVFLAPRLVSIPFTRLTIDATYKKIDGSKAGQYGDRLYLPQINIDMPIVSGGDSTALSGSVWQRNTALGSPRLGGNFVLSGVKFALDPLPWRARVKSPFYNLDKINVNDELTVDYQGQRYIYKVDQKYAASGQPAEKKTDDARLTLYAVDMNGTSVGGVVLGAKLLNPEGNKQLTSFGSEK